jgi:hypothetical protein
MGLHEDLRLLSDQFKKRIVNIKGEEATKQALVLPFLQVLGYDIYDPTTVQPEYVSDFAKKRSGGQAEKVDYAISVNSEPLIFIECKAYGPVLENHDPQLARYFNATPSVKLAVITDGVHYRFFTDLGNPNVMDPSPFFVFNVLSFSERDVENLARFSAGSFTADSIQGHAQEMIFLEKATALVGELLRNPSENFIRFLIDEMAIVQGRVTAKVIERVAPTVRKAIHSTLIEMMTKSLTQEMAQPEPATVIHAAPAPAKSADVPPPSSEQGPRIETTGEELEFFETVKAICTETGLGVPIAYKDTTAYFGVNLHGKVTRWFLRFFGNGPKKNVVFRLTQEQVAKLGPRTDLEFLSGGVTRVYIQSASEIVTLKPLVTLAYDLETKRNDTKGDEA